MLFGMVRPNRVIPCTLKELRIALLIGTLTRFAVPGSCVRKMSGTSPIRTTGAYAAHEHMNGYTSMTGSS